MLRIDALPDPESALTASQSERLATYLVRPDWEGRIKRVERMMTLLGRAGSAITEWDEANSEAVSDVVRRIWREEAPSGLRPLLNDWREHSQAAFLQAFDALINLVNDYHRLLIDDEKMSGHLLRRHGVSGKQIVQAGDDVDELHASMHTSRFDHA